jgi:peptidoglycan/xylan/chitin deacetylase (PgdA/CDA1 family)
LPPQACAITFDDGWRDNFDHAFPVLQRHRAPATIFLVSGMTGTTLEFWPNRLARTLTRLQDGERLAGPLGELLAPLMERSRMRRSWTLADLDAAIVIAKQLDEARIHEGLAGARLSDGARAVLDREEVRLMAASGLIRFGSHTRTHFRFRGDVSPRVLEEEIHCSLTDIAALAGQACAPVFCYPNGDLTEGAVSVVRRHYIAAVTTRNGWHRRTDDPFLIRRVGMHEDVSNRPSGFLTRLAQLI